MIYNSSNSARGAIVFDVEANRAIDNVMALNTQTGGVKVLSRPFQVDEFGHEAKTEVLRYRSIFPIFDGGPLPALFHCYGRQA